jgi:hypothetical protein
VFHARITTHMTELEDILDGLLGQQPKPMPRVKPIKKRSNQDKTKLCMHHARGKCWLDVADCNFAHGENDLVSLPEHKNKQPKPLLRFKPIKWRSNQDKTKLCMHHARGKCWLDVADCNFAHGEDDLVSLPEHKSKQQHEGE